MRFVEKHHLWIMQDGPSDGQTLLHASGKCSHQVSSSERKPHNIYYFVYSLFQIQDPIHASVESQIFLSGQIAI